MDSLVEEKLKAEAAAAERVAVVAKPHDDKEESKHPKEAGDGILQCGGGRKYRRGDGGVVYWKDWNKETPIWVSPFKAFNTPDAPKYVSFEPDEGGFNNVRMSLEIIIVFALVTGRTLILPDEYPMYLLGKKGKSH